MDVIYCAPISFPEDKKFGEFKGKVGIVEYHKNGNDEYCMINGKRPENDIEKYVIQIFSRQVSEDFE